MADPDLEELIETAKSNADIQDRKAVSAEKNLIQYQADYDNYTQKMIMFDTVNNKLSSGIGQLSSAKGQLGNYSSGNKSADAIDLLGSAISLVTTASTSGIEALKIFVTNDMKKLAEDYEKEYTNYFNSRTSYNGYISELYSYNYVNANYRKKEVTITKKTLL